MLQNLERKKMNYQVLKTILFGALIGAALFYMPFFVVKVLIFFLIIGFIFRVFGRRRYYGPSGWAYADKIRGMSDEEYDSFKNKFGRGCGYHGDESRKEEQK